MSLFQSFFCVFLCLNISQHTNPTPFLDLKNVQNAKSNDNLLYFFCHQSNAEFLLTEKISWKKSTLLTTTRDTLSILASYDPSGSFFVKLNNDVFILYPHKMLAIAIENKVYVSSKKEIQDQHFYDYFELLAEGKFYLLKKGDGFFYKIKDEPAKKIKHTKKFFSKIFQEQATSISKFITTNKIKIKQQQDMIKVFEFANYNLHRTKN